MTELLNAAERGELLARARGAGAAAVGARPPSAPLGPPEGRLAEPGAAFVTWKRGDRLRGCIGSIRRHRTLALDVESNAVAALVHDPRFPPATARDFPELRVEISVLDPFEPIAGPSDVEIGRHGLFVEKGKRSGLLLPQVAPEWGWRPEEFLEQVCLKAGLPGDAWRPGPGAATLFRFSAQVFGEG